MMILSLDLGKFKSVFCGYQRDSGAPRFATVLTSPVEFRRVLERERPDLVVFETCTIAGWVADLCDELGLAYQVANPLHEAWSWRKVKRKTDRDDALKLALMADRGELPTVHVPTKAARQYRGLVKYRDRLMTRRVAIQNHIRALCQQQGILLPTAHRAWTAAGRQLIRSLSKPAGECGAEELWRGELLLELECYEHVAEQLAQVDARLEVLARKDERVQLLQTIPGVGRCTAEVIVAHLDDARRFRSGKEVSAYAGLVPRQFQSGELDRRGRITKRGPGLLRKVLVEASWLLLRYNPWASRLFRRLTRGQKTRRKPALVALARKLLVRCWAMLRDGAPWRESVPLTAAAPS